MATEEDVTAAGASDRVERRIALLCFLCGLPIYMIVTHFMGGGRGRAAGLCIAVDALVVVLQRELRTRVRFWLAILLTLIVQTSMIYFVPFGDQSLPAYGLLPAALVIYLFDRCVVFLLLLHTGGETPPPAG